MGVKIPVSELVKGDAVLLGRGYGRKPYRVAYAPELVAGGRIRVAYDDGSVRPAIEIVHESDSEVTIAWT